jgi:hypothetical protein
MSYLAVALATAIFHVPGAGAASAAVERTQNPETENPSGLLVVTPDRVDRDVIPGQRTEIEIEVFNDDTEPVDISILTSDLGPSSDPQSIAERTEDGEFGAGDWLVPEIEDARLEPFEEIHFVVVVDTPVNAPIGTNLGALTVRGSAATGEVGAEDGGGALQVDAVIQFFLTIPGPVEHDLRITDVDTRDTLILGSQRFAVYDVTFKNDGTVNEHVSGRFDVRSVFGNSAFRANIKELIVLRGSSRTTRIIWRDLPWVGAFTPTVRVRGDDARLITEEGERLVIIPWWLPIVFILVIALPPLWLWWRRRQEWKLYMEDDEHDLAYDGWEDEPDVER